MQALFRVSGFRVRAFSAPRNDDCSIVKKPTLRRPCSLRRRVRRRRPACAGPSLLLPRHEGSGAPRGRFNLSEPWPFDHGAPSLLEKARTLRRSTCGVLLPAPGHSCAGRLASLRKAAAGRGSYWPPGTPGAARVQGLAKTCPRAPHQDRGRGLTRRRPTAGARPYLRPTPCDPSHLTTPMKRPSEDRV